MKRIHYLMMSARDEGLSLTNLEQIHDDYYLLTSESNPHLIQLIFVRWVQRFAVGSGE